MVVRPLERFLDDDISKLRAARDAYHAAKADHASAVRRYAQVSRKRETEESRFKASAVLYDVRRRYHVAALDYFQLLNKLRYDRKLSLVEPLLAFMHAHLLFFHLGYQVRRPPVPPHSQLTRCRAVRSISKKRPSAFSTRSRWNFSRRDS